MIVKCKTNETYETVVCIPRWTHPGEDIVLDVTSDEEDERVDAYNEDGA